MKKFTVPCINCGKNNVILTEGDELYVAASVSAPLVANGAAEEMKQPEPVAAAPTKPATLPLKDQKPKVNDEGIKKRVKELKLQGMDEYEIAENLRLAPATIKRLLA